MANRYHLAIDALDCNPELLENKTIISDVIVHIAKICQAKILLGPILVEGSQTNPGLTGFAVIDFSHISIHTFPKTGELYVDVFSCKPFDFKPIQNYIIDVFNLDEEKIRIKEL